MTLSRIFILFFFMFSGCVMANEQKIIYGYVEKATLVDKNLTLSAKLDTGAKSASLSAIDIEEISIDGKPYLRFTVPSKQGLVQFTAEYIGKVKIKVRSGESLQTPLRPIRRPVVLMRLKIGDLERVIPINLTNRKRFIYPLLLGRDAINAFSGLIDPSTAFTLRAKTSNEIE